MNLAQIKFDFSRPKIALMEEKKDLTISFRIGENLKTELESMRKIKGLNSLSDLIMEYAVKGYLEDKATMLLSQIYGDRPLSELLQIG